MKHHKATGIVFIRHYFQSHAELNEKDYLKMLTKEEQSLYKSCVFNQWIPLDQAVSIFEKAALFILPHDENRIEKLSEMHANDSANGVYKVFFKFLTPAFLLKQVVRVWRVYNDHGKPSMTYDDAKKIVCFKLEEFPEMSETRKKMVTGYMQGVMNLTKEGVNLTFDGSNPDGWIWEADYSKIK